ncbi:MAG: hypothetical protein IJR68_09735 [Fretibacterium sp.]|nr:hypothetical protein [Fretibacterium sp.]
MTPVEEDFEKKYVRKDVFDSKMDRMEAIMDRNLAKHEIIAERLSGKIDTLNARLDTLQGRFAWNLAWVAIVNSVALTVIQRLWR